MNLKALLIAFVAGLVIAAVVQQWRLDGKLSEQARLHSDTLAELQKAGAAAQRQEDDRHAKLVNDLNAKSTAQYKELQDVKETNAVYAAQLADGSKRVYFPASGDKPADNVPPTTPAGSVVHAVCGTELHPETASALEREANRADEAARALAACQDYARTIQGAGPLLPQ